ncbi:type I restriction enzyme HsdR N-terminal domain-containing protein [Shewanella algae]|uniref:type I restriction enzyme HsdR N-terminal domain-containing protein n=1 Tax=Shewanella algae TaxID=38313 RepID=UPI00163E491D|nr:type I restriction enzyme HsdR N-terminal domain-containing protein [Shewanella algae]QNH97713.1 type I restriction enzyme HsdR N-terminal domain-containing protein [Shewanella algae]
MSISSTSEAQYEAQIRAAIISAFPWLPSDGITHQDSFSFKFGHSNITIDGKPKSSARARSDILVKYKNTPLAIFELKKPDVKITDDDIEQGLSYARVHHPRPPLVVVSNSKDVRILETETGECWCPTEKSEAAVFSLLEQSSRLAKDDLKNAVNVLLGRSQNVWAQVVKQITNQNINELSVNCEDALMPFVNQFLIPRELTLEALNCLKKGNRLITVEGEPLSGKSNVLREIVELGSKEENAEFLYINADTDISLFSTLSNILTNYLDWYISTNDASNWLMKLSKTTEKNLVLLIDNINVGSDTIRKEVEDLTSKQYGKGLQIIMAIDDTVADKLCLSRNKRSVSAIGNRANRLKLSPLNDKEFSSAKNYFFNMRILFPKGCEISDELRQPWILKKIVSNVMASGKYKEGGLFASISPVVSLELLHFSRRQFDSSQKPFCLYRELAKGVLEELQDSDRAYQLQLELLNVFIIRRDTALKYISSQELAEMSFDGLIREKRSESGENCYIIRLPELMACELSRLIASDLAKYKSSESVKWLVNVSSHIPLGNIIAADAISYLGQKGELSLDFIKELLKLLPTKQTIPPGTKFAASWNNIGVVDFTVIDERHISIEKDGDREIVQVDPDDIPAVYDNISSYMILSYLSGQTIVIENDKQNSYQRIDPIILAQVGSATVPLFKMSTTLDKNSFNHHELDDGTFMLCTSNGIVEPITWSLMSFFIKEYRGLANEFIEKSMNDRNTALISRIYTALTESLDSADEEYSTWAKNKLALSVKPALSVCLNF